MKVDSSSISIISQMNNTNKKLSKTFAQLATGKRVNSAKDDPAAIALAGGLEKAINSLNALNQGTSLTQGALDTASGALNSTLDSLQSLRDLAVQSANGTLSESDRTNLQNQYDQTLEHIDSVASQTSFNGNNLIDGSFNQDILTGTDGQTSSLSLASASSSALGISSTGISDQASAADAISAIDAAISQVETQQANIGATQNALDFSSSANAVQAENLAAAKSNSVDANYADIISQLKAEQVQQAAQIAALKAQNASQKDKVKVLIGKA